MQKELERTKQKQQLLKLVTANVSHELIAPLKSIISFVSILFGMTYDSAILHNLEMVQNTAKMLLS